MYVLEQVCHKVTSTVPDVLISGAGAAGGGHYLEVHLVPHSEPQESSRQGDCSAVCAPHTTL